MEAGLMSSVFLVAAFDGVCHLAQLAGSFAFMAKLLGLNL